MTDYEQKIFEQVIDDYFCKAKPRAKIVVEEKKEVHVNGSKLNNNLDESRSNDNGKKKRESKSKALFIEAEYQDNLPSGWKKVVVQRTTGATAGKFDVFFFTPSGRKLRSKNEIKDYSDKNQLNLDLSNFGFSRPRKEKYLAKSPGKKLRPATSTVSPSDNSSNSVTDQSSDVSNPISVENWATEETDSTNGDCSISKDIQLGCFIDQDMKAFAEEILDQSSVDLTLPNTSLGAIAPKEDIESSNFNMDIGFDNNQFDSLGKTFKIERPISFSCF